MKSRRRNTITRANAYTVAAIAVAAGVLAAFAGCHPTGEALPDILVTAAFAGFVTWAGASSPWWALLVGSSLAALVTIGNPFLAVTALIGFSASIWLGVQRRGFAPMRALIAAAVVQALLRSHSNPWFLASAFTAAAVALLLILTGLARRPGYVRVRVLWGALVLASVGFLAAIGMAAGGLSARSHAIDGYRDLVRGLNAIKSGDPTAAAKALRSASTELNKASDSLGAPWTQPARLFPVLAQHRSAGDVMGKAADAAAAAAKTLDVVDLSQLTVQNGVIDVEALSLLATPLDELRSTVDGLATALGDAASPWLFTEFQSRLDKATVLAHEIAHQAETSSVAAQRGPALLGIDGLRRYFVAFTSSAEARGQTGLMGNWAEITIDHGRMKVAANGRTAELINGLSKLPKVTLQASDEFFARFGQFGAGTQGGSVTPKYWSNITMPPDTPTVGTSMAQLYEQATGRPIDGVFIIDTAGIAALLELTGPVTVPDVGLSLSASTVEQFLLLDQYSRPENERRDVLEAVTQATIDQVLGSLLPSPQVLAADLGPAATQGHISGWAKRPEEQHLFDLAGIDARLPTTNGHDGLAVVSDNASGSKIDSFLQREVRYDAEFDQRTGKTIAVASISLTNTAPATGYPDYVIGNIIGLPVGTNRTLLSLYSPLTLEGVSIDGKQIGNFSGTELGWNVYSTLITLAPGEKLTVRFTLAGNLSASPYELVYRPQPLRIPERLFAKVIDGDGHTVAGYAGTLKRRSVLSLSGLVAWR